MKYRFAIELDTRALPLEGSEVVQLLELVFDKGLRALGHSRGETIGLTLEKLRLRPKEPKQ